jgi:SAM-dependent methyltransferase
MLRVLKPGGRLIVHEMYRDNQTPEQLTHVGIHHWWANIDTALGIVHNETFIRQQLLDFDALAGLRRRDCYDHADLDSDPHDPALMEMLRGHFKRYLDRAKELPDFLAFQARGDELARRLDEIGVRWATALLLIGEK